jgi:hypothetical protein
LKDWLGIEKISKENIVKKESKTNTIHIS